MKIIELSQRKDLLDAAIKYFWNCWGNDSNYIFYKDCIIHSLNAKNALPKFFLALEDNKIIGSYALITNDLISRQDLMPWFACLFVNENKRSQGIAELLLKDGLHQARAKGFDTLYLSTDLENFYENKGWTYFSQGYNFSGEAAKIYSKNTK